MPNYNVQYARPAKSLLKLRDELNQVFPVRFTGTDGFLTGYGQGQITGHNPNQFGHVMAFDISTPADGEHITEAEGRDLADYLRTQANIKFRYLIHDMSAGAPLPEIAGDFNGWVWGGYVGDNHSNHIHVSLTDDYLWGDDCGLSPEVYDDESSWGVVEFFAGKSVPVTAPQGGVTSTPSAPAPVQSGTFLAQVEANDTLTSIAAQFGTSVDAIIAVNPGINPNLIFPNQMLNIPGSWPPASAPAPAAKSISQLADETIAGVYGSGQDRVNALGANYDAVQAEVNSRYGIGSAPQGPSISDLADAVIRGDYGSGQDRINALGANYDAVQAEVNRRYGL